MAVMMSFVIANKSSRIFFGECLLPRRRHVQTNQILRSMTRPCQMLLGGFYSIAIVGRGMFATIRELEQLQGGSRAVHSSGLHCCVCVLFESRQIGSLCVRAFVRRLFSNVCSSSSRAPLPLIVPPPPSSASSFAAHFTSLTGTV